MTLLPTLQGLLSRAQQLRSEGYVTIPLAVLDKAYAAYKEGHETTTDNEYAIFDVMEEIDNLYERLAKLEESL